MTSRADPTAATPGYADLEPSRVLDALDAVGLRGDGRLLQLNSYENRVFQAHLEDGDVVVAKFYRPGRWSDEQILEEHAFAIELAEQDVPVVAPRTLQPADAAAVVHGNPPTLAHVALHGEPRGQLHRLAICDRHAGRGPELEDPDVLAWLGRFLARLHATGARAPFLHRRTLDPSWVVSARERLLLGHHIPEAARPGWLARCDEALALIETAFASAGPLRAQRLHGDFHPGNVMWRPDQGGGPHVVDLDDACNGPAVQDLWMLLSGDEASMRRQLVHLLDGYRTLMAFDDRELLLVEPLRTLRMICHSAWIAERWSDPAFPIAFPYFGGDSYWAQQAIQLDEQIVAMRHPPALSAFN